MNAVLFAGGGTGGHLYPALALAAALANERPEVRTHFVGALRGVEARVLPTQGVEHTLLPFEPLRRDRLWANWRLLPSGMRSALGLRHLFRAFRPDLVVGTGGYASAFAGFWALSHGVPLAIQEQNSYPGLTQRALSRWAKQVHLGFPEARRHLHPGRHTEVFELGNPIRPPDPALDRGECRRDFGLEPHDQVVLAVGGSQGARAINEALIAAVEGVERGTLPRPPRSLRLLWAAGPSHVDSLRERLAATGAAWVRLLGYIEEMPRALAAADLAVSRAGAMATAELLAWGVPAILVPLPSAAADHQTRNAEALGEAGAAVHLPQSRLDAARLWSDVLSLAGDDVRRAAMAKRARERGRPTAARDIARKLLVLLKAA